MIKFLSERPRLSAASAIAGGLVWAVAGVVQLTADDLHETKVQTFTEHLILVLLAGALVLTAPGIVALARKAQSYKGATVAVIGMLGLAVLATSSNINGEDFAFFPPVAIVVNLMWLGGMISLAVSLRRAGRVSKAVAICLPLTFIAALPLSSLGGGILIGAYWIAVGSTLHAEATERRTPAIATA
jgi:hypothetical protein